MLRKLRVTVFGFGCCKCLSKLYFLLRHYSCVALCELHNVHFKDTPFPSLCVICLFLFSFINCFHKFCWHNRPNSKFVLAPHYRFNVRILCSFLHTVHLSFPCNSHHIKHLYTVQNQQTGRCNRDDWFNKNRLRVGRPANPSSLSDPARDFTLLQRTLICSVAQPVFMSNGEGYLSGDKLSVSWRWPFTSI